MKLKNINEYEDCVELEDIKGKMFARKMGLGKHERTRKKSAWSKDRAKIERYIR